jgi:ribA/ribD-fused uncharacterized protein
MSDSITRFHGEYVFLNNFYMEDVTVGDITYRSVEHGFQARKTFNIQAHDWVMAAPTAAEAKKRGQQVPLRPYWDQHARYVEMELLLGAKFDYGSKLGHRLGMTSDKILIEGNDWHDNVWGDCQCGRASCVSPGLNLLGWMLMRRRSEILLSIMGFDITDYDV